MKLKLYVFALLFSFSFASWSAEQIELCVKYWRPSYSSWSRGYKVNAYLLDASEMNQATQSYNHSYLNNYVLIEWDNGGYSAIKVRLYENFIFRVEAEDQHGRRWQLKKNDFLCH